MIQEFDTGIQGTGVADNVLATGDEGRATSTLSPSDDELDDEEDVFQQEQEGLEI